MHQCDLSIYKVYVVEVLVICPGGERDHLRRIILGDKFLQILATLILLDCFVLTRIGVVGVIWVTLRGAIERLRHRGDAEPELESVVVAIDIHPHITGRIEGFILVLDREAKLSSQFG